MNKQSIEKIIGKSTKIDWKKPKAIGSSSFYLKSFKAKNDSAELLKENSKCSFEKYSNGILLRSNLSNKLGALAIKESKIKYIKLIRGKESVEPLTMSPMWIMLKLGVSKLIARYFRIVLGEYSIDEMKLKIETENQIMEFTQNGYIFERQLSFFKNLNYGKKLIIEMNE
tara:strand:- start:131 stop:640 length:510 start_codon:yes stop_codon:yes gene_type:complete